MFTLPPPVKTTAAGFHGMTSGYHVICQCYPIRTKLVCQTRKALVQQKDLLHHGFDITSWHHLSSHVQCSQKNVDLDGGLALRVKNCIMEVTQSHYIMCQSVRILNIAWPLGSPASLNWVKSWTYNSFLLDDHSICSAYIHILVAISQLEMIRIHRSCFRIHTHQYSVSVVSWVSASHGFDFDVIIIADTDWWQIVNTQVLADWDLHCDCLCIVLFLGVVTIVALSERYAAVTRLFLQLCRLT